MRRRTEVNADHRRCNGMSHERLARRYGKKVTGTDVDVAVCVPRLVMTRRLGRAEQAAGLVSRTVHTVMLVLAALSPENMCGPDVVVVDCVGQVAIEATTHRSHGHQKPGEPDANSECHSGREPQAPAEVKRKEHKLGARGNEMARPS